MGVLFLLNVQMFGIEINSTLRTAMGFFFVTLLALHHITGL